MKLTTKGKYAVTAMLDLALHQGEGPIALADISHRQEISLSYLEQLFSKLRKQNLVTSVRGPGGGYKLASSPSEISVAAIIKAVDETVDATSCNGKSDCQDGVTCLTHNLWTELSHRLHQFLNDVTLGSLMERREIQAVSTRQQNQIDQQLIAATLLE